ncbi:RNA-directed DNA methylation 4 [Citrus sinensis]|nr:RNA-directed DNA methylation 4 [Citrus sinensis]
MASSHGESSSALPKPTNDKPVIVRVKRKASRPPLEAFWLEINERPLKRPLLDFEKLSISSSSGIEELKARKVFVQHVETATTSEANIDIVQSFVPNFTDVLKTKSEERRLAFKKDNRHDQNLSKARQQQEKLRRTDASHAVKVLAKNARFEQIWRSRKGHKEELHHKELREMCHFYDVVRVDGEEKSNEVQRDMSLEDQRLLSSYLPMLREFLPGAAAEIESDMCAYLSKQDDYVYDYYAVNDDMNVDEDASSPFPLVQVDDEEFYDGPDESEYDSEDSNAEDNPRNEYPDEISDEQEEEEEEEEEEEVDEDGVESKATENSEDESERAGIASRDIDRFLEDEIYYDDFENDDHCFDNLDDEKNDADGEDWRWSYR